MGTTPVADAVSKLPPATASAGRRDCLLGMLTIDSQRSRDSSSTGEMRDGITSLAGVAVPPEPVPVDVASPADHVVEWPEIEIRRPEVLNIGATSLIGVVALRDQTSHDVTSFADRTEWPEIETWRPEVLGGRSTGVVVGDSSAYGSTRSSRNKTGLDVWSGWTVTTCESRLSCKLTDCFGMGFLHEDISTSVTAAAAARGFLGTAAKDRSVRLRLLVVYTRQHNTL